MQPKLLWVNVISARGDEPALGVFARSFDIRVVQASEFTVPEQEQPWDVLCFNFDYPDMAGLRLIPDAKRRWPSVPILMLAAQGTVELVLWALRSGVFDLLVKPVTHEEIERVVGRLRHALDARRTQSERRPPSTRAQLPVETRFVPSSPPAPRLEAAIAHVAKHYHKHISEARVALLCDMSPSRFCREFKNAFDVTFVEYVATYRVSQAKRLLANPNMLVADVALAVGFNDPSYFTRVFRKQEGLSPTEYRVAANSDLASTRALA